MINVREVRYPSRRVRRVLAPWVIVGACRPITGRLLVWSRTPMLSFDVSTSYGPPTDVHRNVRLIRVQLRGYAYAGILLELLELLQESERDEMDSYLFASQRSLRPKFTLLTHPTAQQCVRQVRERSMRIVQYHISENARALSQDLHYPHRKKQSAYVELPR